MKLLWAESILHTQRSKKPFNKIVNAKKKKKKKKAKAEWKYLHEIHHLDSSFLFNSRGQYKRIQHTVRGSSLITFL